MSQMKKSWGTFYFITWFINLYDNIFYIILIILWNIIVTGSYELQPIEHTTSS